MAMRGQLANGVRLELTRDRLDAECRPQAECIQPVEKPGEHLEHTRLAEIVEHERDRAGQTVRAPVHLLTLPSAEPGG
jgi:hypothetical protein